MNLRLPDKKIIDQSGFAALLSTMVIMAVILIVVASLSLVTLIEQKISANIVHTAQAYYAAESGIEDSLYRLIKGHDYSATNNLTVGDGAAAITISDVADQKYILAAGQKDNRFRKLRIKLNAGGPEGTAFYYGVQVGEGGLIMDNNSRVQGSVYSNGSIQGSQGATITADAWVANNALIANQQSQANDTDFVFGQASPVIDAGQSFTPSVAGNLIKVSLLLKKFGAPTNKTVRLLTNNSGQPSKTLVSSGAYGSLITSQVSNTSYSWVDISLNAPASLQAGVKYWIVIDSSLNEDNYLFWGKDSTNNYGGGEGQSSPNWSAGSPVWSSANGDLAFKAWFGQPNNFLDNVVVGANAHANTIRHSAITGNAYYQTINDTTVGGTRYPGSADPASESMPIPPTVIDNWKSEAEAGGVINGDYSLDGGAVATLGPKKIVGNLTVSNQGDLTISGTLFVTGNINIYNNAKVRLGSNFGEYSGVILTDGLVTVANGCVFYGANDNTYILILSTKSGQAINIANNSDTAIFYAANGSADVNNNTILKELTAYQIHLNNGAEVIYESGLASILFSAGVSGGAWDITSWEEVP
ncbi:pilus assembly PilX N-terminal domain-containing protein [Patescibacteria group bacterium]|nr:pilus assembly PilX N-terminal domain-containing protein [Patescibacteria group bacterium]